MKSRNYDVLNALPPEAFLDPESFRTGWGAEEDAAYCAKQYAAALDASKRAYETGGETYVQANGTWGASGPRWCITTYEGIGYHAGTAAVLRGLLDGPGAFYVYRRGAEGTVTKTLVKPEVSRG